MAYHDILVARLDTISVVVLEVQCISMWSRYDP
jgi:hypothetical protein